jgi:membrane protease YdiL (CAAX protease family)
MELTLTSEKTSWFTPTSQFKTCVKEFLAFVKNPSYINQDTAMLLSEKVSFIKQLLKFKALLLIVIVPILIYTKRLTGASYNDLPDTWGTYLAIVMIAPILEEIIFRYGLRYSKTMIACLIWFPIYWIIKHTVPQSNLPLAIGFSFFSIPIIRFALKPFDVQMEKLWIRGFPFLFHVFAITFGIIHLSNYSNISNCFLAIPLVSSQIVSGYVLGFIRMKFGLIYSMGLHSAWNFFASFTLFVELIAKFF